MLLGIKSYIFIIKCSRKISELEGWRNRFLSPVTWIWRQWCTRGTNNPAVKTTRNHWSSLFLVQRLVPSTITIPSPTKKKELWQLGWRQDSILTLWYNNRKTRGFSNQASQHLLNYWSFTTATLMPRRGKRKEKYLNINNQQNLQKTQSLNAAFHKSIFKSEKFVFWLSSSEHNPWVSVSTITSIPSTNAHI